MLTEQEFSHFSEQKRVNKIVHSRLRGLGLATWDIGIVHSRLRGVRLATWYIGALIVKKMEFVNVMRKRKICITCL